MEGRERKRERKTGETARARERQDESKKVLETEKQWRQAVRQKAILTGSPDTSKKFILFS